MAHVFVVDEKTFKIHLEYMFAGTGNDFDDVDLFFLNNTLLNYDGSQDDKRAVAMVSDIARVRRGDKIIFYVQGIAKFFGVFKAKEDFFFDKRSDNYLKNTDILSKTLTYRILIEPDIVYEKGITEYDYLDSTKGVNVPQEMCWSLIYRKLRAARGCTAIFDYEYNRFVDIISNYEGQRVLNNTFFSFDGNNIINCNYQREYAGLQLNISNRLFENLKKKKESKKAFEHYLQYEVIERLKSNNFFDILDSANNIIWLGNEVSCGFGMQKIDVLAIQESDDLIEVSVIELKDEKPNKDKIVIQIDRYLEWLFDYLIPILERQEKRIHVIPIVIGDKYSRDNKQIELENAVTSKNWDAYNTLLSTVKHIKMIKFKVDEDNLTFY